MAASMLVPCFVFLLAVRWRIFLRQQSISVPLFKVWTLTWAGQFFNSVLPGSTGGDVFKIYQACRHAPTRKPASAASVIVDRLVALGALVALALFGLWNGVPGELKGIYSLPSLEAWWIPAFLAVVFVGGALARRLWRTVRIRELLDRLLAPMRLALRPSRSLAVGFVLALAVHLLTFLSFYLFARSLGIGITYTQVLMIVPVVLLLVLLPVTVNGHGLREVLLVFYFSKLHLSAGASPGASTVDTVVALSVLLVTNDLLWSSFGGLLYLATSRSSKAMPDAPN